MLNFVNMTWASYTGHKEPNITASGLDINACPTARGKLEVGPDKLFQKELARQGK